MPPLAIHTRIAKQIADELRAPALDAQRGNLYLGSTAPDIRVVTRWERERTHFFDIHNFSEQSSVDAFFASNPELAEAGRLDERTQAFLAGYLTHLVVDERWIGSIYRPFFGERSPLGGTLRANVMDRALQFSLDADVRRDADLVAHIVREVACCDLDLGIGFIDRDTLGQWHGVITDYVQTVPDWDRFRTRTRRHMENGGQEVPDEDFEELARSLPDLVAETLRYLTPERVEDVFRESVAESAAVVKGYLKCA